LRGRGEPRGKIEEFWEKSKGPRSSKKVAKSGGKRFRFFAVWGRKGVIKKKAARCRKKNPSQERGLLGSQAQESYLKKKKKKKNVQLVLRGKTS